MKKTPGSARDPGTPRTFVKKKFLGLHESGSVMPEELGETHDMGN